MFSKVLFKRTLKENFKFWIWITVALCLLMLMLLALAGTFIDRFPPEVAQEFDASSFIRQFYEQFAILLPMIYIISVANKLVAVQVDRGYFAFVLSRPIKRNTIVFTQFIFLMGSIIVMFIAIMIVGFVCHGLFGINLDVGKFLLMNLGVVLLLFAITGICFMSSCIFNTSGKSLLIGATIPIISYVCDMLTSFSMLNPDMELFKYFSLNTLYSLENILAGDFIVFYQLLMLFIIGGICTSVGVIYFIKKDIPV